MGCRPWVDALHTCDAALAACSFSACGACSQLGPEWHTLLDSTGASQLCNSYDCMPAMHGRCSGVCGLNEHRPGCLLRAPVVQGGDLRQALTQAPAELHWYCKGASVALDIIKGLHFLHKHMVSATHCRHQFTVLCAQVFADKFDCALGSSAELSHSLNLKWVVASHPANVGPCCGYYAIGDPIVCTAMLQQPLAV